MRLHHRHWTDNATVDGESSEDKEFPCRRLLSRMNSTAAMDRLCCNRPLTRAALAYLGSLAAMLIDALFLWCSDGEAGEMLETDFSVASPSGGQWTCAIEGATLSVG